MSDGRRLYESPLRRCRQGALRWLRAECSQALGYYLIPGACNPALAQRVLSAEPDMGLLLPCNVVVRRGPDAATTTVQAINPQTMAQLRTLANIEGVADEADTRLRAALKVVESAFHA